MGLTNKWEIEQTWGSHQAVLKAVLQVLKPQSAIECGCGDFSTPYLQTVPRLHTIEHDPRWASKVCSSHPPGENHQWTTKIFKAKNPTRIEELPQGVFNEMCSFYTKLTDKTAPFDLLFVDTFTACRVPAISTLGVKAQWIIVHDLEPPGPEVYRWDLVEPFLKPWRKYIHKPMGMIGSGHQIPWTGLYSRLHLPLEELNKVVERESQRLWNRNTYLELIQEEHPPHD